MSISLMPDYVIIAALSVFSECVRSRCDGGETSHEKPEVQQ